MQFQFFSSLQDTINEILFNSENEVLRKSCCVFKYIVISMAVFIFTATFPIHYNKLMMYITFLQKQNMT